MKTNPFAGGEIPRRNRSNRWRRVTLQWRLIIRKLQRAEFVEVDEQGNPKTNPIRWTM